MFEWLQLALAKHMIFESHKMPEPANFQLAEYQFFQHYPGQYRQTDERP
jgi:hypothetical protein